MLCHTEVVVMFVSLLTQATSRVNHNEVLRYFALPDDLRLTTSQKEQLHDLYVEVAPRLNDATSKLAELRAKDRRAAMLRGGKKANKKGNSANQPPGKETAAQARLVAEIEREARIDILQLLDEKQKKQLFPNGIPTELTPTETKTPKRKKALK